MRKTYFILMLLLSTAFAWAQSGLNQDIYEGPSVLSRGGASTTGERAGRLVDFQFWGSLTGVYDTDMGGVGTTSGGVVTPLAEEGIAAGGGIVGNKLWRHDEISLDYTGDYRHYTPNSSFDGTDQFLQFDWKHTVTRHISFDVHEVGGTNTYSYGELAFVPLRNTDLVALPANQLFDNKTYFDETGAEIYWQKTARLSFGAGGEGFIMNHQSPLLANVRGAEARLDAVYRLTRRQKAYLTWSLLRFDYQRAFGYSTLNTYAGGYSIDIGRRWTIEAQGGAIHVHTLGLIQQPIDPTIAAIIGTNVTTTTADRTVYIPDGQLRIIRRFRRSAIDAGGGASVSPGNGIYLTSRMNTAYANYSVIGSRRLSLAAVIAYSSLSGVGQQTIGKFSAISGGVGATYRLKANLHGELRYDLYHYTTQNNAFQRNENRVSAGIAFSSGERPLAIW